VNIKQKKPNLKGNLGARHQGTETERDMSISLTMMISDIIDKWMNKIKVF
jgi:hypothetical protein